MLLKVVREKEIIWVGFSLVIIMKIKIKIILLWLDFFDLVWGIDIGWGLVDDVEIHLKRLVV